MVRTGKVVSCEKGLVSVCFERPEACARCNQCGDFRETLVSLPGEAAPGDIVEVFFPEGKLLKYTAVAYVIPLAGLLAGLLLGRLLFGSEAGEIALALVFAAAAALIVVRFDRRARKKGSGMPAVIRVLPAKAQRDPQ